MRHFFTIIILIGFHLVVFSQTSFEHLTSDNQKNIAIQAIEITENEYLLSFITNNNISNCNHGIIKLSANGTQVNQSFFCNDSLILTAYDFHKVQNEIIIMGIGFNPISEKSYSFFRKIDENFSILSEVFHYLTDEDIAYFNSFIHEGIIHCSGTTVSYNPFVATLEIDGQLFFSKFNFDFTDYINRLLIDEDKYILRGNRLRVFDSDFNLHETISEPPFGLSQQGDMIKLTDSTYLISGKKLVGSSTDNRQLGIGLISSDFEEIDLLNFGLLFDTIDFPGFYKSLSRRTDGNIYFGGTSNMEIIPSPYGSIPSWFNLSLIDDNLNILWNNTYGGDSYYNMFGLLATSDGGCMMYGFKHDYQNNPNVFQLYVLKVDENGDILSSASSPILDIPDFQIYPNPFANEVFISQKNNLSSSDLKLKIYNNTGKLLQEISNLSYEQAIYTSTLRVEFNFFKPMGDEKGQLLTTMKLIKK